MTLFEFVLYMLPFVGFALVALYVGYVAYETQVARERARLAPQLSDPIHELERVNTELGRAATAARLTLENARETVRKGTR